MPHKVKIVSFCWFICLILCQVEEVEGVFEDIDQDEYDRRQAERREDDFIVDDEGFGYKDHGGEIWEVQEGNGADGSKKKRRKLNVSGKDQGSNPSD